MKAKAKAKELRDALDKLASLPGRDTGLSGNSIVTIDADEFGGLRLCRSTIEAFARITCESDIEEAGRVAVPYIPLVNAIRACGDKAEITLFRDERELVVNPGDDEAGVSLWPDNEVIPAPPKLIGVELSLSHDEFMGAIKVAHAAASTDSSRPAYLGVCFRKVPGALAVFGCNGHRAHLSRIAALVDRIDPEPNGERDYGALLSNEGVECAKKVFMGEKSMFTLTVGKNGLQIDAGEMSVRLPISSERPPFMDNLLSPAAEIKWSVEKKPLLAAAKDLRPTSGDGSIKLCLAPDGLKLAAHGSNSRARRTVPCQSEGSGEYYVESAYLVSLLECAELETLHLWIVARGQQLYYREGERDFLVMFRQPGPVGSYKKK